MTRTVIADKESEQFVLRGLVQGQGVRPTIARIAKRHGIFGTVRNSLRGVEIRAVGDARSRQAFQEAVTSAFNNALLVAKNVEPAFGGENEFRILDSVACSKLDTTVPLDLAVCRECLDEVRSPNNRRFRYPFTTCTRCGPRYSILDRMPFDRQSTSMAAFAMCPQCEAEYRDPNNRRFHAQTIACSDCGPRCWATARDGKLLSEQTDAIGVVAKRIASGDIAAVKGIGGYQLVCDATNSRTVSRLRKRKHRFGKPLPVMASDVSAAALIAELDEIEREALQSPANPIVLVRWRAGNGISPPVSCGLNTMGVILPTSPMHAMLIDSVGHPLVVTSGNAHGAPLVYNTRDSETQLAGIADVFLHHDREITRPIDDSVVQCYGSRVTTIRAARGIAPTTMAAPRRHPSVAVGGHQKVAPALSTTDSVVLAPHIGDMDSEGCRIRFQDSIEDLQALYQTESDQFVCDRHPDYFTTSWSKRRRPTTTTAQHHHAHVAAAMLEHGLLDQTVLGLAFDGTGFGDDETVWGGEALLATTTNYQRVGHLRHFRLPGGENAIRYPPRITQSLLSQLDGFAEKDKLLQYAIEQGPVTSSMGRLFDGVAAMLLDIETIDYEGEAALRLECHSDAEESDTYRFDLVETQPIQFDWRPVLTGIRDDLNCLSTKRIAMKFHRAVANLVIDLAMRYDHLPCVVTGGVFQNRLLLTQVEAMASDRSLDVRLPEKVPVNDGGLALGQLVIAGARHGEPTGAASCA